MMRTTEHPGARCPLCLGDADLATGTLPNKKTRPTDGDVCICFQCEGVSIWTDGATRLRAPGPIESMALHASPRLQRYRAVLRAVKRENGL